jgi:hypothetical protein
MQLYIIMINKIYLNSIKSIKKKNNESPCPYTGLSARTKHLFTIQKFDKTKLSHINNIKLYI